MEKLLKIILKYRKKNSKSRVVRFLLQLLYKIDLPREVIIGDNLILAHNAPGLVVHPQTEIGNNVKLYQGVTLGRADIHKEAHESEFEKIKVEDCAIICAGAKILCKKGELKIAKGSLVGANSVLTCSTGENEVWAGIPAKKIGYVK